MKSRSMGIEPDAPLYHSDEKTGDVLELGEPCTLEEEKAILRKIDLTILPMVCLTPPPRLSDRCVQLKGY